MLPLSLPKKKRLNGRFLSGGGVCSYPLLAENVPTALSDLQPLAQRKEQIELFYLPSYNQQLNPEERLNGDLKQEMSKRVPVRTKAKLRQAAAEHMTMLEQAPERAMGYFQDRHVKYAA